MVDLYEGSTREGVRGGLEQFSWDSIKSQVFKNRECYLGQSVQVGIQGKFGRFFRNDWWFMNRNTPEVLKDEQKFFKRFEDELMQEAFLLQYFRTNVIQLIRNLKPKRLLLIKSELTDEQKEMLKVEFEEADRLAAKLKKKEKKKHKKKSSSKLEKKLKKAQKNEMKAYKHQHKKRSSLDRD